MVLQVLQLMHLKPSSSLKQLRKINSQESNGVQLQKKKPFLNANANEKPFLNTNAKEKPFLNAKEKPFLNAKEKPFLNAKEKPFLNTPHVEKCIFAS